MLTFEIWLGFCRIVNSAKRKCKANISGERRFKLLDSPKSKNGGATSKSF